MAHNKIANSTHKNHNNSNQNNKTNNNKEKMPLLDSKTATTSCSSNNASNYLNSSANATIPSNTSFEQTPHKIVYKRMETIVEKMQDETNGIPIRTVKSFMSKIPSVFIGSDLVHWLSKRLDCDDMNEVLHFSHLLSAHGYVFPIDDHILTVKNDSTFYRFQTPYYWPSNHNEPDNTDYAVYLCKRTMQNKTRLELADYEAENLAKLQKLLSRKWEFIYMQAEAQIKIDKKRDKMERKIIDSQERAFWDVHRPAPGCVNTTECDMRKTLRTRLSIDYNYLLSLNLLQTTTTKLNTANSKTSLNTATTTTTATAVATVAVAPNIINSSLYSTTSTSASNVNSNSSINKDELLKIYNLKKEIDFLKRRLERRYVKTSKVSESYSNFYEQYIEFDPFITPSDPSNPWITDSTEFWDMEKSIKDIPQRRVRRWGFSIHELLKDPVGRDLFRRFLEKEYSSENLRFYDLCNSLRYATNKDVANKVIEIYNEFLAPVAHCPINIDSRIMAITKAKMENPDRYTYDEAREHIFNLMTRDSYNRFLKSDIYRDTLLGAKKKIKSGRLSIVRHPIDQLTRQYASTFSNN